MTINLDKTITWLPPVNSNVSNFRNEFDRIYGNFSAVNASLEDIMPRLQEVESELILTAQNIQADLAAYTPVYFDVSGNQWKQYFPWKRSVMPALFLGGTTVALNGALVDVTHSGNILYVGSDGALVSSFPKEQLSQRESIGYRVGTNKFKLDHRNHGSRLREFGERIYSADIQATDVFGHSLAVDGEWLIVGAHGEDSKATNAGSVYMFRYNGHRWIQESKLNPLDPDPEAYFGGRVKIQGDLAVIGARGDDAGKGSAYVFRYDGANWNQEAKLTADVRVNDDHFGNRLAIHGNVIAITANYQDTQGTNAGAAYVFRYDGTNWNQEAQLLASDGFDYGYFGSGVDVYEDTIVVGGKTRVEGVEIGAAYIFRHDGSTWVEEFIITADDQASSTGFGYSPCLEQNTLVLGAYVDDEKGSNAGAAYVFFRNGDQWTQDAKLLAENPAATAMFGTSVGIQGDTVVIGQEHSDTFGNDAGSAYIYNISEV